MRLNSVSSSASSSFCADCLISSECLTTRRGMFQALGAVLRIGNAFFLAARFRNHPVQEVFPNGPEFFQVNEDTDLAALFIGDKLDSGLGFIFLQGSSEHSTFPARPLQSLRSPCPSFASSSLHPHRAGFEYLRQRGLIARLNGPLRCMHSPLRRVRR